jgi:hypothetical protein
MSDLTKKKAEALFNGAMNMFSSPSAKLSTAASHPDSDVKESTRVETMESNPEDIPKEDLLHLSKLRRSYLTNESSLSMLSNRKLSFL